jgi:DNA-binding IclR family transcriptional regulator
MSNVNRKLRCCDPAHKGGLLVIQSVDRALRILAALQGARRLSLGEIASRLDLAPSTVHGIIRTLLAHGMVAQERDSQLYRLGPATLRLGNVYLDTLELRSGVASWAGDLARRTGCAVRTGVLLFDDVVVVHHEPRPDGTRQMPEVGIVIPAHACALGKALLAFDPDGGMAAVPRSMTGETVTDPAALAAQLDAVRRTGIATEAEEAVLGECGAAAPLAGVGGELAGAIGLVVPAADWPLRRAALDALRTTARAISRELGAQAWPPPLPAAPPAQASA